MRGGGEGLRPGADASHRCGRGGGDGAAEAAAAGERGRGLLDVGGGHRQEVQQARQGDQAGHGEVSERPTQSVLYFTFLSISIIKTSCTIFTLLEHSEVQLICFILKLLATK